MARHVLGMTMLASALAGCAGLYGEVAFTSTPSTKVSQSGGAEVDAGGGTTVGFNVGIDFSGTMKRFSGGYAATTTSFDGGESKFSGAQMRYDHGIISLPERLSLRVGAGLESGKSTGTSNGMTTEDNSFGFMGGVGATYFATWRTPVHLFVGAHWINREAGDERTVTGAGVTARLGVSLMAKDPRGDSMFVVPLEGNRDLTGVLQEGAAAYGCDTLDSDRTEYSASLKLKCGSKRIDYFQIASGILVTCRHEPSEERCEQLSKNIVKAARAKLDEKKGGAASAPAEKPAETAPTTLPSETPPAPEAAPAAPAETASGSTP
ncbi:MAG: hypothetical protein SFX73_19905 [Kofleriaceae bacterium]|nr:hypothetical protein [Kofleriaceae bacterium]